MNTLGANEERLDYGFQCETITPETALIHEGNQLVINGEPTIAHGEITHVRALNRYFAAVGTSYHGGVFSKYCGINQDRLGILGNKIVLCDGVGGFGKGSTAYAGLACQLILSEISKENDPVVLDPVELNAQLKIRNLQVGGTTFMALQFVDGGIDVTNCGDIQVLVFDKNGRIKGHMEPKNKAYEAFIESVKRHNQLFDCAGSLDEILHRHGAENFLNYYYTHEEGHILTEPYLTNHKDCSPPTSFRRKFIPWDEGDYLVAFTDGLEVTRKFWKKIDFKNQDSEGIYRRIFSLLLSEISKPGHYDNVTFLVAQNTQAELNREMFVDISKTPIFDRNLVIPDFEFPVSDKALPLEAPSAWQDESIETKPRKNFEASPKSMMNYVYMLLTMVMLGTATLAGRNFYETKAVSSQVLSLSRFLEQLEVECRAKSGSLQRSEFVVFLIQKLLKQNFDGTENQIRELSDKLRHTPKQEILQITQNYLTKSKNN